jgi:DNA-binding CsgD family transcriptional regulator
MAYKSPLARNRRSILLSSAGIGALFSILASFSFGRIGPLEILSVLAYGLIEGGLIGGTGMAIQSIFPAGSRKRVPRMLLDFSMGAAVHAVLSFALWGLLGVRNAFLTGIVGFLSMLVGELVSAQESAILAREEATLAEEGRSRLPPGTARRFGLSQREAEVAELLYARASYKDICDRLFISLPTVKSHISAIYRKSDSGSRREFMAAASAEPGKD